MANVKSSSKVNFVLLQDSEGNHRYDELLLVPAGMTAKQAVKIIDAAVIKVKAADPEEFTWDDLEKELAGTGITQTSVTVAGQTW